MTRLPRTTTLLAFALALDAALAPARAAAEEARGTARPVLVELFTSLGCSTCPPADRLISRLATEGSGVVALAFHVDYWNRAGWSDPFSRREWSERQAAYARRSGATQVFTPQAYVDGGEEVTGSDEARLASAIAAARARPAATLDLSVAPAGDGLIATVRVVLPGPLAHRDLDLFCALEESGFVTQVSKGENGGRALASDHVVRSLARAGRVSARPATARLEIPKDAARERLAVVAFVVDPRALTIHGVARAAPEDGATRVRGGK